MATRILIVSDIQLYVEGLTSLLVAEPTVEVTGAAHTLEEAFRAVENEAPDIVLVDLLMTRGLTVVQELRAGSDSLKIAVLTASELERDIAPCAMAGVAGYLTRDDSVEGLVSCLDAVTAGELYCSQKIAATLASLVRKFSKTSPRWPGIDALTRRERSVLELMDKSNKEIARQLNIEVATVKNHVHHILEKLEVHSRSEAIATISRFHQHP